MYLTGFSYPATLPYVPYVSPGEILRVMREARGIDSLREAARLGGISLGSVQRPVPRLASHVRDVATQRRCGYEGRAKATGARRADAVVAGVRGRSR